MFTTFVLSSCVCLLASSASYKNTISKKLSCSRQKFKSCLKRAAEEGQDQNTNWLPVTAWHTAFYLKALSLVLWPEEQGMEKNERKVVCKLWLTEMCSTNNQKKIHSLKVNT